jgi:antitoxin YefM
MKVANASDLRKNLKSFIDYVADNNDPLIVNGNGKTVVMISLDDYNSWDETAYLLSSPANVKALQKSIAELKSGKIIKKPAKILTSTSSKKS